jgi:hypothetical protein
MTPRPTTPITCTECQTLITKDEEVNAGVPRCLVFSPRRDVDYKIGSGEAIR